MSWSWHDEMRPCVREAFDNGAQDREHLRKMRFGIIYEMRRLGLHKPQIKQELLQWNEKNCVRLSPNDAKRQLCGFVDWFFERECRMSCKALRDYCLGESRCGFKACDYSGLELPFRLWEAREWLMREYPARGFGYCLAQVLSVMVELWEEKGRPQELFVGLRTVQARLLDRFRAQSDAKNVSLRLYRLADAGFLEITHGRSGVFGFHKSNGYRFLQWKTVASEPLEGPIPKYPICVA